SLAGNGCVLNQMPEARNSTAGHKRPAGGGRNIRRKGPKSTPETLGNQATSPLLGHRTARLQGRTRAPISAGLEDHGEVPEWSIGTVSKTVVRASVPWVRIPPSPPSCFALRVTPNVVSSLVRVTRLRAPPQGQVVGRLGSEVNSNVPTPTDKK